LNLTSSQRKYLRSLAHHLKPRVYIGKNSITKGALNSIDESLESHELIKVKSHDNRISSEDIFSIKKQLNCDIAGQIGKTIIIYRQNSDKDLQKIKLPK